MIKATAVNEVQVVLQEYLGRKKALEAAEKISTVMQGESQHTHNGETFYVHRDKLGTLALTMESEVKNNVELILYSYLKEDEVQECLEHLMGVNPVIDKEAEMNLRRSKDEVLNCMLMNHIPANKSEEIFQDILRTCIQAEATGKSKELFQNMLKTCIQAEATGDFRDPCINWP